MSSLPRFPLVSALAAIALAGAAALAAPGPGACDVAGAGIEELIARTPALRESANAQVVRDLRTLRDAAIVLDTYKRPEECRRLVTLVRKLAANPATAVEASGDTDEEAAERVAESREPKAPAQASPAEKAPEAKAAEKGKDAPKP